MAVVARNQPCPCGSGMRYKECHGALRAPDDAPSSAAVSGPIDRQRRMLAALEAQKAARVGEAAALYQSVLDEEPENFDAMHMLGVIRYELGQLQQAEALVRRAIAVNPYIAAAHANLRLIRAAQERRGAEGQLHREVERMQATGLEVGVPAIPTDVRVIAFYLPQYHSIAENDEWWGPGFTEWTNVRKALPNFVGHEQPHEPAELGYYDLRSAAIRQRQADLAEKFGVHGFCYYAYWFNGHRLLEQPLDEVLASGKPDFPFCVCWANENWTRRWDGLDQEILIGQDYSVADSTAFIRHLLPVLADRRYIRVEGRPLLLVYKLDLIPHAREMAEIWRAEARRFGLGELYLCAVRTTFQSDPSAFGFDGVVQFPPHGFHPYRLNAQLQITNPEFRGMVFDYRDQVIQSLDEMPSSYETFPCVMPAWDNTARRQNDGTVFIGSSPDLFEYWLHAMIAQTRRRLPVGKRLVFVNAWNEWGEGCHLEPDRRYGHRYLTAVRNAMVRPTHDLVPIEPFDSGRDPGAVLSEYLRDPTLQVRQFAHAAAAPIDSSLVSIVVPVYNHARYLRESIASVFSQTHSAIELIAIDDGSTDGSFELLSELATAAPCPVVLVRQPNAGAPAALNRALAVARGDYIAVLNSDDAFAPTRIATMLAAIRRQGAMLAFSDVEFMGRDGTPVPNHPLAEELRARIDAIRDYPSLLHALVLSNVGISTGNLFFSRALLSTTGGFRALKLCHDWDFLLSACYGGQPVLVPERLYKYRLHETNTFAAMRLHAAKETETVYRRFFTDIAALPQLADERKRERFLRFAYEHGCRGYFQVPKTWRFHDYSEWVAQHGTIGDTEREELRRDMADFARRPLLSILLPTHNSDARWLRRCLDSVRNQLYPAWELCIADDASTEPMVRTVLEEYCAIDARIKIVYLEDNLHISIATNTALDIATGEFAVLLDHDDELAEDALYWVAREILEHPDAILIYSDEDKINEFGVRVEPYFKPDWNPELLRAQNCISHLGVMRIDALKEIGKFRAGLEGAQDWDAVLRLSERCKPEAIRHIPRILYHWRTAGQSTARSMQSKPYASSAQRQTIAEHLMRMGRIAKIEPTWGGAFWRVEYVVRPGLKAAVVVDGRGPVEWLSATLTALVAAPDPTIECFRVITDSADGERVVNQFELSAGVEAKIIRSLAASAPGIAWNAACGDCSADLIVLLVAGIRGLTPGWCERLGAYAQNPDSGIVSPALFLPDGSFHNAGILLDAELATVRAYLGRQKDDPMPGARQALAQNLTVPGSEILAFRREIHAATGGFDNSFLDRDLLVADFCLQAERLRLRNVWTPYVEGMWGGRRVSPFAARDPGQVREFLARWQTRVHGDPAYNPNLARGERAFDLAFPPRHGEWAMTAEPRANGTIEVDVRDHA